MKCLDKEYPYIALSVLRLYEPTTMMSIEVSFAPATRVELPESGTDGQALVVSYTTKENSLLLVPLL